MISLDVKVYTVTIRSKQSFIHLLLPAVFWQQMHFLLKLAYEMHIKVLVNNEFMFPFHMCCRSLYIQQTHHLVFPEVNHNWILKNVKSRFFLNFIYLLLIEFAFKISPVVLFIRNALVSFPLLVHISSCRSIHNLLHPNSMHIYTLSAPRIS